MPRLEMSIALVTRNRPDSLKRTLYSLREQGCQPFEVIVSDDSDEANSNTVRALCEKLNCKYVEGPKRGLYANRNAAAAACSGSHVRTMDDDHEFPRRHIEICQEAIASYPKKIWIIGECLPEETSTGRQFDCPPQLNPRGYSGPPSANSPLWGIADGASIYPSSIFRKGIGFYEGFVFGAAYLEWGSRLTWLGYEIDHLSSTFVIHHFDSDTRSFGNETGSSSRLFAALCHSFRYQPTLINRILTAAELGLTIAKERKNGIVSARTAINAYLEWTVNVDAQRRQADG